MPVLSGFLNNELDAFMGVCYLKSMIILIGGEKGGTGKTTVTINLAAMLTAQGKSCVLVDTDHQESARTWCRMRRGVQGVVPIECVTARGSSVENIVSLYAESNDYVLVDTAGRDSEELRAAMLASDVLCSPVPPAQFDLSAAERLIPIIQAARDHHPDLRCCSLISRATTHHMITDVDDAREFLEELSELPPLSTVVHERSAYKKAAFMGVGVTEMRGKDRNKEAITEMTSLYHELIGEAYVR